MRYDNRLACVNFFCWTPPLWRESCAEAVCDITEHRPLETATAFILASQCRHVRQTMLGWTAVNIASRKYPAGKCASCASVMEDVSIRKTVPMPTLLVGILTRGRPLSPTC